MTNQQYSVPNEDVGAETFAVPGDVTDDAAFELEKTKDAPYQWYIHVHNGFNEQIKAIIQGTHYANGAIQNPVDESSEETLNPDQSTVFSGETGHSFLQTQITTVADPTQGALEVTYQSRKNK